MMTTIAPPAPPAPSHAAATGSTRRRRHRRRIVRADLLAVAAWASAAASVALYLAEGRRITNVGEALTAGGIVAGLVGSDLVLMMLILAARIPLIDRAIGQDRAMGVHRQLGKPAFVLLLVHGLLVTLGYAWTDRVSLARETAQLFGTPDLTLAYVAIALFAAVVVTSLIAVRRRFRYEVWYLIHLLSYAAVLVALPHQLSQGVVFAQGTWQRVYWIALYVIALGSIVTFRVAEPLIQSLRHGIVVSRVERIADDAVSLHLRGRGLDRLKAEGGQYFSWRFWTGRSWWHAHPISLSAAPSATSARITVRESGAGTRRLASAVRRGTRVSFAGPYGIFTDAARGRDRIAIMAAGIGITPARALLEELDAPAGAVTVLVRATSPESLYLWDEVRALCAERGWEAWTSVGPRAAGSQAWLSAADVARGVDGGSVFPLLGQSEVYICGPGAWSDAVEQEARRRGLPAMHIHRERFDW